MLCLKSTRVYLLEGNFLFYFFSLKQHVLLQKIMYEYEGDKWKLKMESVISKKQKIFERESYIQSENLDSDFESKISTNQL